jgi:hypothetical protein
VESTALIYFAYMMTDGFLWCYRETFDTEYHVSDGQLPSWFIKFTPAVVRDWTKKLTRSSNTRVLR